MAAAYAPPTKIILTPAHLAFFQDTETYKSVNSYIERLNEAITGAKLSDECSQSKVWPTLFVRQVWLSADRNL